MLNQSWLIEDSFTEFLSLIIVTLDFNLYKDTDPKNYLFKWLT